MPVFKVLLVYSMPFCLLIVYGYICTVATELNGCKKDYMAYRPKILTVWLLKKKIADPCFRALRVALNFAIPLDLLHLVEAISETFWTSPL